MSKVLKELRVEKESVKDLTRGVGWHDAQQSQRHNKCEANINCAVQLNSAEKEFESNAFYELRVVVMAFLSHFVKLHIGCNGGGYWKLRAAERAVADVIFHAQDRHQATGCQFHAHSDYTADSAAHDPERTAVAVIHFV